MLRFSLCSGCVWRRRFALRDAGSCALTLRHAGYKQTNVDVRMRDELSKDKGEVGGIYKLIWELRARCVVGMELADEGGEAVDFGAGLAIQADLVDAVVDELVDHLGGARRM